MSVGEALEELNRQFEHYRVNTWSAGRGKVGYDYHTALYYPKLAQYPDPLRLPVGFQRRLPPIVGVIYELGSNPHLPSTRPVWNTPWGPKP